MEPPTLPRISTSGSVPTGAISTPWAGRPGWGPSPPPLAGRAPSTPLGASCPSSPSRTWSSSNGPTGRVTTRPYPVSSASVSPKPNGPGSASWPGLCGIPIGWRISKPSHRPTGAGRGQPPGAACVDPRDPAVGTRLRSGAGRGRPPPGRPHDPGPGAGTPILDAPDPRAEGLEGRGAPASGGPAGSQPDSLTKRD